MFEAIHQLVNIVDEKLFQFDNWSLLMSSFFLFFADVCYLLQIYCEKRRILHGESKEEFYHGEFIILTQLFWFSIGETCIPPQKNYTYECLFWTVGLWLLGAVCIIIHYKIYTEQTWKGVLRSAVKAMFRTASSMIKDLKKTTSKCNKYASFVQVVYLVVGGMFIFLSLRHPSVAVEGFFLAFSILWVLLYLLFVFDENQNSCGKMIIFLFEPTIIIAFAVFWWAKIQVEFNLLVNIALYIYYCLIITVFWCLSLGGIDRNTAKLTGNVVNTFTTIALLTVNVLAKWLDVHSYRPGTDWDLLVYIVNFAALPVVTSGYLSMLFLDGLERYEKKQAQKSTKNTKNKQKNRKRQKIDCN